MEIHREDRLRKKKMEKVETQDVPSRNEDLFITI